MVIDEITIPETCAECVLVEKNGWPMTCRYYTAKKGKGFKMNDGRSGRPEFCKITTIILSDKT